MVNGKYWTLQGSYSTTGKLCSSFAILMNKFYMISFAIITIMYSKKSMCPLWSSSKMLKIDSDRFLAWFPYRSLETSMNNFLLLSQCQNGGIMKLIFQSFLAYRQRNKQVMLKSHDKWQLIMIGISHQSSSTSIDCPQQSLMVINDCWFLSVMIIGDNWWWILES